SKRSRRGRPAPGADRSAPRRLAAGSQGSDALGRSGRAGTAGWPKGKRVKLFGIVGVLAFVAASFAVGLRLSWTGLRRGGIPESTIGLSFLLAGGIGTLLMLASNGAGAAQALLRAASLGFINLGIAVLGVFNWRAFRPDRTGALLF